MGIPSTFRRFWHKKSSEEEESFSKCLFAIMVAYFFSTALLNHITFYIFFSLIVSNICFSHSRSFQVPINLQNIFKYVFKEFKE